MDSYFSLIKFVNNNDSNENIVVGLIVMSGEKLYYNISQTKLAFTKKLNPKSWRLFDFSLSKFNSFLEEDNDLLYKEQYKIFSSSLDKSYFSRLSNYQNGVFQITKPESINMKFDKDSFYLYFKKLVGEELTKPHPDLSKKRFEIKLKHYYQNKVFHQRADLNYRVQPDNIPGLFFPVEVDFIAKNGQLLVGQAIDFNSQPKTIAKRFNEFENLVYNLEKFSNVKKIDKGSYNLIYGRPQARSEQEKIFNDIYRKKDEAPFKIIEPEELNEIAKLLESRSFEKFSDYLMDPTQ
ncbi:hypothetical protein DXT99_24805 [Pontibacter diazotrophicus]|uniref:DUF3037 domain-containing protein n=1 Tax=Pontibacter diazotrophicus TaxID=1400979 RepID=A0A3D8L1U4_9BACT|nr:hypothetical protein [Pontibacter diazotrophicus]RDV11326.1 hypothetical protein DXT99_24805 [Pontibacter diazotrophicus]